jgi:hypothetical protein
MALEKDQVDDDIASQSDENPNRAERIDDRHPRDRVAGREKGRDDMRSIIKAAIKENPAEGKDVKAAGSDRQREATGKFSSTAKPEDRGAQAAASPDKPIPETGKTGETAPSTAPQAPSAIAAPAALSKEIKAIWDKLDPAVQSEFARREADTAKGVEQLKAQFKPLQDAFAPVRGQLQQLGKTEAEAAAQLIQWQEALADPRRQAQAFRALAQAHKFDLSTLGSQAPAAPGQNSQPDPSQAFRPLLDPLNQKVSFLENEFQRQQRERVQGDIANFAQGKPHFDKVSVAMGHLMQSGLAKGANAKEVFDDAYARACRADPDVFAMIQQEEQAKREAESQAAQAAAAKKAAEDAEAARKRQAEEVAKARKAGVGPRAGSPNGMAISAKAKGTSVRESLMSAVKESSAAI